MFDAYGTLFDVHSIAATAEELAPRQGAVLSQIWRTKQLEYTWLQSLMIVATRPRDDFATLTAHALDYAVAQLMVPLGAADRQRLLDAYGSWRRSRMRSMHSPNSRRVRAGSCRTARSRCSSRWFASSVLAAHLDGVSVRRCCRHLQAIAAGLPTRRRPAATRALPKSAFVSSNGWDAAGAKAFGFTTFWINRNGDPVERHAPAPDYIVGSLAHISPIVRQMVISP